jgi:polysaccharide export outer membrane protein
VSERPFRTDTTEEGPVKKKSACILLLLFFSISGTTASAKDSTYLIGPGDILEISVWKDESLSKQIIVPPDFVISFPLAGDIDVTDLTVPELRKTITEKLAEYIPDATVAVLLFQINSMKAYVIGKVNKPGEFPISMETNVMQVLSMGGGLNPFASSDKILILRQQGNETVKIPFNYKQVEKGQNLEQNILLQRGDVVVVP